MLKLNKLVIIIGFFALTYTSFSQTQLITFAPMGLVNKFRVKYEYALNENLSAGTYFNGYYMIFKGVRLDPFVRLYPTGSAPKGFYIQVKAVVGYFNSNFAYDYSYHTQVNGKDTTITLTEKRSKSFPTYGAGLGIGYQFLVGKHKMPIDLFLGFQYSKFTAPQTVLKDGVEYTTADDVIWCFTGPGSFLNANFGIGFSF